MTDTQRPCRGLAAVSVGALLVMLSGCDVLSQAGGAIASAEKEAAADSITVVNEASEPIDIFLLEEETAYKAFWTRPSPGDLPVLSPGESIGHAMSSIRGYEKGKPLYISIGAEKEYSNGEAKIVHVSYATRSWKELRDASFRVEITDEDLPEKEN